MITSNEPKKRKNQLMKNLVDCVRASMVEARKGAVTNILAMLTTIMIIPLTSIPVPKTGTSMFATFYSPVAASGVP